MHESVDIGTDALDGSDAEVVAVGIDYANRPVDERGIRVGRGLQFGRHLSLGEIGAGSGVFWPLSEDQGGGAGEEQREAKVRRAWFGHGCWPFGKTAPV